MAEQTLSVVEARRKFADVLGRVAYGREEIIIARAGQPMAVLINVEEHRRLKALDQKQRATAQAARFKGNSTIQTVEALFDGEVLRPEASLELETNARVHIVIEAIKVPETRPPSFLRKARSLNLQGPPDWSARFEDYLYAQESEADD